MQIPVKVKATGEIVDVTISVAVAGNPLYTTSGGVTYLGDDIEPAEPDWQHYRIQAAIAAMQGMIVSDAYANTEIANSYTGEKKRVKWGENKIAKAAIAHADALIAEIKRSEDVYAECRRMDAINTASVCKNMTKLQKELQKEGEQHE